MQENKRVIYNYLLPRSKRKLTNYVSAILGLPALTLFILSFYLGIVNNLWYFILSAMGLFFSQNFIYTLWSYFKYENLVVSLSIDLYGVGFGFKYDTIEWGIWIDGIYAFELEDDDWWVIRHRNGTWLYFPNGLVSEKEIEYLQQLIRLH